MKTNVELLIEGKKITDGELVLSLHQLILKDQNGNPISAYVTSINDEIYYLYQTPEEIEIDRLKAIIENQNKVIQEFSKPKVRGRKRHLDKDELEDLYAQFALGKRPSELYQIFGIGKSTCDAKYKKWNKEVNINRCEVR